MASAVNPLVAASNAASATSTVAQGANAPAPSEQMFLQLLVSQIQNQDPLNPTDSSQFVSQLAQFSQLEQVIAIRGDIEKAQSAGIPATSGAPAAPNTPASGNTAPGASAAPGTPAVPVTPGIFGGSSTTGTPSGATSQS